MSHPLFPDAPRQRPGRYNVAPDQFVNVTTPEVDYILGLLWADGHIAGKDGKSQLVLLTQATEDMLDVSKTLSKTGYWKYNEKPVEENEQPSTIANICNYPVAEHLVAHGYETKSIGSADSILSTIPDHLKHYWFRGLFDGDGCLWFGPQKGTNATDKMWSIASDYKQNWRYLQSLAERLNIDYKICRYISRVEKETGKRNRNSTFLVRRHQDIHIVMNYLYQGREHDGIGLDRKWHSWLEFKNIRFRFGSNRYPGITKHYDKWKATIPKKFGIPSQIYLGRFDSEALGYEAQQAKMKELGIVVNRERIWGAHNQAVID